jgi:hypothetical protein
MYQRIDEEISVIGVYKKGHFEPKRFQWKNKILSIERITLISEIKDGIIRKRLYSVLVKGTLHRLLFNRDTEKWTLEEIWVE